jgi:predicted nucleotide-binding protein
MGRLSRQALTARQLKGCATVANYSSLEPEERDAVRSTIRSIIAGLQSFFGRLRERNLVDEGLLNRASKRLEFLSSIVLAQDRVWRDGQRYGFHLVDYINGDDLGNLDQFLNGLENAAVDSVNASRVLDELDSLLTTLLQNLCLKTWQIDEPIRTAAAAMAANYRDQFTVIKTLYAAGPEHVEPVPVQPPPSVRHSPEAPTVEAPIAPQLTSTEQAVFIVHGRAEGPKHQVARLVQAVTGLEPVILDEQEKLGTTIIEKLEEHLYRTSFAIVLLTGDDEGRLKGTDNLKPRARQNVILETGLFIGAIKRRNVALLYESGVELPSDMEGLMYIELDRGGGWRSELAREMRAAGLPVDMNKL